MAMAARMPMIATTIISSMSVKPPWLPVWSRLLVHHWIIGSSSFAVHCTRCLKIPEDSSFELPHLPCQPLPGLKTLIPKTADLSAIPAIDCPRHSCDENRHGRTTVVPSPVAEIVHIESAVFAL